VGFVGALVVFFLLMVWVGLGSVVVVFGWVISVAIVLRVRQKSPFFFFPDFF
jgi:hypothetical protein